MARIHHVNEIARRHGKTDAARTKLMRAIRAACKRHGLDDDARRDMQAGLVERGVVQHASMAAMSVAELGRMLDGLNAGWSGPTGHRAHIGKIRALWWSLYWLGAVDSPDDTALDAFVRRQTGVSALRFLDHRPAASVVEALKDWAVREGVTWEKSTDPLADRRTVYREIAFRLAPSARDAALAAIGLAADDAPWRRHEYDAAIRAVGKAWRVAMVPHR